MPALSLWLMTALFGTQHTARHTNALTCGKAFLSFRQRMKRPKSLLTKPMQNIKARILRSLRSLFGRDLVLVAKQVNLE